MKKKILTVPLLLCSVFLLENETYSMESIIRRSTSKKIAFDDCVITDISAGTNHNLALDSNGNLWAWGNNDSGQLGDGTKVNSYVPKQIMVGHKFKQISAGNKYSAAIDENGYLYGWGDSYNPTKSSQLTPTLVSGNYTYSYVLSGYSDCITVKTTETKKIPFGYGHDGYTPQIIASNEVDYYPEKKTYDQNIIDADSNYYYYYRYSAYTYYAYDNFIVLEDGTIDYLHRYNFKDYVFFDPNIDVSTLTSIIDVSCRKVYKKSSTMFSTAYFLDTNGVIYSIGNNGFNNMLGSSSTLSMIETLTPVQVDAVDKFTKISAGENHVLAISEDGGVYSWGDNGFGQLGVGNLISEKTPVRINAFDSVKSINITAYPGESYKDSIAQENGNSYRVVQEPEKGTLNVDFDTGSFEYTANPTSFGYDTAIVGMYYGMDYVEYQVNIYIDRKPFVSSGNLNINVGYLSSYSGKIPVSDSDGDRLKFSIHEYPSKGNIVIDPNTGMYTYTSKKDCAGQDKFIVDVSDGYYTLQVPINVHIETNVITNDATELVLDNTNPTSYSGNMNASDLDGDKITYSISGEPSKGSIEIDETGTYKYTPRSGEYGQDTFSLTATDGKTPTTLTYNVELYEIKDNSTILDHKISVGTTLNSEIKLIANNCTPIFNVKTDGSKGNVSIDQNSGKYTYTPKPNTSGADSFVINVNYGYGDLDFSINVYQNSPADVSEVVQNITTKENTNYTGNVTSTDVDSDTLQYKVVTYPRLGRIDLNELTGEYTYYPSKNTGGNDVIHFEVSDGINITPIQLNIKIESEIEIKESINAIINQNTSLNGNVDAKDKDGDTLNYNLKVSPTNGSASVDSKTGEYTYIPKTGYFGEDTFTIEVNDGTLPKVVRINVTINRKPISDNIEYNFVTSGTSVSGSAKCTDPDGDTLTYYLGEEPKMGSVNLDRNTGNFAYVPNSDAKGNDRFIVVATDGHDNIQVTINVHNETELVLEEQETNIIVNQGKSTTGNVLASDLDGDKLTYSIKDQPTKGTLNINEHTGAWTYNSNQDASGQDSFSVEVTDGNVAKKLTYNLIINTPSNFEEGTITSIETNINTPYNGAVKANDENGDALIYSIVSQGQKGNVSIDPSTGRYIYTPTQDASGNDTFIIGANDGNFITEISINVHIETEIKVENGTQSVSVDKDKIITGQTNASDADGDKLTYRISKQGEKGNANVTEDGSWSYLANNGAGDDSFIVEVSDGKNKAYVTIYVHINSEPSFSSGNINVTVGEGQKTTGKVEASDEDGDTLEYKVAVQPNNGTVNLNSKTGEFEYFAFSNNSSNTDNFTVSVTDGTTTKEIVVNVLINGGPSALDSTLLVDQDKSGTGSIVASDPENDKLTYQIGTQGTHGNVTINNETGKYVYITNDKNYSGSDSFTVLVSDGLTVKEVVVNVTIKPNKTPVASNSSISLKQDSSVIGQIEASDHEKDKLIYEVTSQGTHGVVSINKDTGEYTYKTTDKNYIGSDSFVVTISDGYSSKQVVVNVSINKNQAPTIQGENITISQNGQGSGKVTATDVENNKLSYEITSQGNYGTITINKETGEYTYISTNKNFSGRDSFVVTVNDGYSTSTIRIYVDVEPNKTPSASNGNIIVNQGEYATGNIVATDPEKDELTYEVSSQASHGKVIIDRTTGEYTYVATDKEFKGTDSFVISISDGYTTKNVTIEVTIIPNKTPSASNGEITLNQGGSGSGLISATDPENDELSYEISSQGTHGNVSINSQTGEYTYVATDKTFSGVDSFVVSISDGYSTKKVVVKVTITPNEAPSVNGGNLVINQNGSGSGTITATDPENDKLTFEVGTQGTHGNVSINSQTGEYVYVSTDKQYSGKDSFVILVSDGINVKKVIVEVDINQNKSPISSNGSISVNQNGSTSGTITATDPENDKLTFEVGSQGSHGQVVINKETGDYTYVTADKNYSGKDTFIILVTDGYTTKEVTITVDVIPNEAPITSNGSTSVNQNGSISGTITASDPENDKLTFEISSQGLHGNVVIDKETGEYTYTTTDRNYNGKDSFKVLVTDGYTTKEVIITVEVVPNNGPITGDANISVNQNGSVTGHVSASDPEDDKLTFEVGSQGSHGKVTINKETGEYTYITNDKDFNGKDSFTVKVSDGYTTKEITIFVEVIRNEAPVLSGSNLQLDSGTSVTGVVNATDKEGDKLSFIVSQQGQKGNATINQETGEYVYTANPDTEGYDSFVVTVSDGYKTRTFVVEVNIKFVDSNNSWAIPTVAATGTVALASLTGLGFVLLSKKKKAKNPINK